MSSIRNHRVVLSKVAMMAAVIAACAAPANAGWDSLKIIDQTGCSLCCPACEHVCHFKAEQGNADKTCFEVESKVICIPRVVFPWQKRAVASCDTCDGTGCNHCVHNGARTRRICVLSVKEYECPECKYTWTPQRCGTACDDGCDAPGCDETNTPYQTTTPLSYRETAKPRSYRETATPMNFRAIMTPQNASVETVPARQSVTNVRRLPQSVN